MKSYYLVLPVLMLAGCFSSTRYVSDTRPDTVLVDRDVSGCYRLASLEFVVSSDDKCPAEGKREIQEAVGAVLRRNYPALFPETGDCVPLHVMVNGYRDHHPDPVIHSPVSQIVFPEVVQDETLYKVAVRSEDAQTAKAWSDPVYATRQSETWESYCLPIAWIPIPGRSDWSRNYDFMNLGRHPVGCYARKIDCDVLAAAVVRALNRHQRELLAASFEKGGAK